MNRLERMCSWAALFLIVLSCVLLVLPKSPLSSPRSTVDPLRKAILPTSRATYTQTAPLVVEYFDAHPAGSDIELLWRVFSDRDVEGFRLYRVSETDTHLFVVNKRGLIPAWQQLFLDKELPAETTYQYLLGVVFSDGSEFISYPVQATTASKSHSIKPLSIATWIHASQQF